MRLVLRLIGGVLLAVAVVLAVSDIARSLAGDVVRLAPLGSVLAGTGLGDAGTGSSGGTLLALVAAWPASVVAALAAFAFLALGRARRPAGGIRPLR